LAAVFILALGACDSTLTGGRHDAPADRAGQLDGAAGDWPAETAARREGSLPGGDRSRAEAASPDKGKLSDQPGLPLDKPPAKLDKGVPQPDFPPGTCAAKALLASIGKSSLLVGASMEDAIAKSAPFDLRYQYLAGGIFDQSDACASCATGCTAGGKSCAGGACGWWGCWQWDQDPPGKFLRDFIAKVIADKQIPMISYYEILQGSGVAEGKPEVTQAATSVSFMSRYYADWRFVLKQIGNQTVFLHIEPDFWGYAQQVGPDPAKLAAAVASANPTDCAGQPNTVAGMGSCMIAMVRKYAPNAKVGLHASAWASGPDVSMNTDPALNVPAEAAKVATFLAGCGAKSGDFVVVEASDRDAGYYSSIGQNRWWDATNTKLPTFNQHFTWAKALAAGVGRPLLWWQLPVGNMSLPNTTNQWKDNRVDYFFGHTQQVADSHGVGMAFGAGAGGHESASGKGSGCAQSSSRRLRSCTLPVWRSRSWRSDSRSLA
jgi:hypothetical protein